MATEPSEADRAEQTADPGDLEEPDQLELIDSGEEPAPWQRLDLRLATNPIVIRSLIGIAAAFAIMAWPDRTNRILARLLGVALVAFSGHEALVGLRALRSRSADRSVDGDGATRAGIAARLLPIGTALIGLLLGVYLLLAPRGSEVALARLAGVLLAGSGLRDLVLLALRNRSAPVDEDRTWPLVKALALVAAGAVVLSNPSETFALVTVTLAIGWMILGAVALTMALDGEDLSQDGGYLQAGSLIREWLLSRPKDADDRRALYAKILYEGPLLRRRVVRFATLMSFAAVIASMGVITDSTAVVIGAMLIAPLMTPLMGMAISLVMGWPTRLRRSATIAAAGITLAIGIGVILGLVAPTVIDTATNSQIIGRSSPTILDLIVALAAGAAGAYGLSRPDVSDSLPGVAIAISLVPPLTVVGIAYSQGDWGSGHGALLLFATNMLAILIMGGFTFVLTGVTPVSRVAENQHRVKTWLAAVGVFGALVLGALLLNGSQIAENALRAGTTEKAVDEWLDPYPQHEVVRTSISGDTVTAVITGPDSDSPPADELAELLREALDRPVTAQVQLLVATRDTATAD